jgi:hypothetical protein
MYTEGEAGKTRLWRTLLLDSSIDIQKYGLLTANFLGTG